MRKNVKRRREVQVKLMLLGISMAVVIIVAGAVSAIARILDDEKTKSAGVEESLSSDEKTSAIISDSTEPESESSEDEFLEWEYPEYLLTILENNPETEEFVRNYPKKQGTYSTEPLTELLNQDKMPLIMQWDARWGYYIYGDKVMGATGCGPTCLSMVAIHLLQDAKLTPIYIADYAMKKGYYYNGTGTSWELMSVGAKELGLSVSEVPLDENRVMSYLKNGKPIICCMGPGDFTNSGHFIVFVGVENGKIIINDPNSKANSEKRWEFEDIKYQIRNMWAYSKNRE